MDAEPFTGSVWSGDKTNGIETRYQGGEVDEVCLYVDGECVLHLEQMSDQCFWMGLRTKNGYGVHVNIFSKNGRSHLGINAEESETPSLPTPTASGETAQPGQEKAGDGPAEVTP
jgi:hypothetical protein